MDKSILLYEKFKLIERNECEINGAWKGAHLLLFFLAFVFGSFCTFCFHMLTYLFDEKCVLYPKLLSLTTLHQNIIYEFIPYDKNDIDSLPVDFVSTQWVEQSVCYLPTYVPLVSGIFGLVWTTMCLMCLTGSRVLTGLQKSWRILPSVFVFSLAMGSLCAYTSAVTTYGLQELCLKLGEITGNPSCSFTVNVATLAYERRIRGVYQAIKLTVVTSWLHTSCWILSALLTVARVLLAVDFQLVKVSAHLKGNIDRLLEKQEHQVVTVSPDYTVTHSNSHKSLQSTSESKVLSNKKTVEYNSKTTQISNYDEELINFSKRNSVLQPTPESVVPRDDYILKSLSADNTVANDHKFIANLLSNMVNNAIILSEYPKINQVPIIKDSIHSRDKLNFEEIDKGLRDHSHIPSEKVINSKSTINTKEDKEKIKSNTKQNLLQTDSQTSVLPSTSENADHEKKMIDKETQTQKEKQE